MFKSLNLLVVCLLDVKLAVQVGLLLLRNNKELETVLEATEKQYEEQKLRADVSISSYSSPPVG